MTERESTSAAVSAVVALPHGVVDALGVEVDWVHRRRR
jgi:hypothetical protein